jgi:DNA-binding NtrC family response regulator
VLAGHAKERALIVPRATTSGAHDASWAELRKHGVTVHVLACQWAPVIDALKEHGNNKSQTAKTLGITREGLHKKLKGFGSG